MKTKVIYLASIFIIIFYFSSISFLYASENDSTSLEKTNKIGIYFSGNYCDNVQPNSRFYKSTSGSFGYKIDLSYLIVFNKRLSLGLGISYSKLNYDLHSEYNSDDVLFSTTYYTVITDTKNKINYLEIPVHLQMKFGNSQSTNFKIEFGPSLTALIKGATNGLSKIICLDSTKTNQFNEQNSYGLFSGENKADISYSFFTGAGIETQISNKINLETLAFFQYYAGEIVDRYTAGIKLGLNYKLINKN